jgi:hypothetical protein
MSDTTISIAKKLMLTLGFVALIAVFAGTSLKTVNATQGVQPFVCGTQSCYYKLNYICTNQGCSYCDPATNYTWCASSSGGGGGGCSGDQCPCSDGSCGGECCSQVRRDGNNALGKLQTRIERDGVGQLR